MAGRVALLFDLDGTLVDSALDIAAALSSLSAERGGDAVPVERVRKLVSHGAATLVREALGAVARNSEDDLSAFRAILSKISPDPALLYPGVVTALAELTAAGHAMAVVTNKPEGLSRQLIEQLDLARFFGAVVGGDTLAVCKPDPAPLYHAIVQLGCRRDGAVMIGDSAVDADAAEAAGLPFWLFTGGYDAAGCAGRSIAARFADFADLADFLSEAAPPHGSERRPIDVGIAGKSM